MAEFHVGNPNSLFSFGSSEFMSKYPEFVQNDIRPKQCITKHTPTEWEAIREEFSRLYKAGFTLPEIVRYFRDLGFDATERQYKRRIDSWRLTRKNIKSREKEFMVRKEAQRQELGKQTTFWINDRLVDQRKLKDARKKILSESYARSAGKTPTNITYKTPQDNSQITYHGSTTQEKNVVAPSESNLIQQGIPIGSRKLPTLSPPVGQNQHRRILSHLKSQDEDQTIYRCDLCYFSHHISKHETFLQHLKSCHYTYSVLVIRPKDGPELPSQPKYWWPESKRIPTTWSVWDSGSEPPQNVVTQDSEWDKIIYGCIDGPWRHNEYKILGFPIFNRLDNIIFQQESSTVQFHASILKQSTDPSSDTEVNHPLTVFDTASSSVLDNHDDMISVPEYESVESNLAIPDTQGSGDFGPFADTELEWLLSLVYDDSNTEDST